MRFIIGIIICLFLLQASAAWADTQTEQGCHDRYSVSLDQGERSLDVAYRGPVTFTWALPQKVHFENPQELYTAEVSGEYGYFECSPRLEISTLSGLRGAQKCLRLKVNWRPGTDRSGCFVDILKNGKTVRRVELYMNY